MRAIETATVATPGAARSQPPGKSEYLRDVGAVIGWDKGEENNPLVRRVQRWRFGGPGLPRPADGCVESQASGAPAMSGGALVNLDVKVNGSMQHGRAFLTLEALRKMSEETIGSLLSARFVDEDHAERLPLLERALSQPSVTIETCPGEIPPHELHAYVVDADGRAQGDVTALLSQRGPGCPPCPATSEAPTRNKLPLIAPRNPSPTSLPDTRPKCTVGLPRITMARPAMRRRAPVRASGPRLRSAPTNSACPRRNARTKGRRRERSFPWRRRMTGVTASSGTPGAVISYATRWKTASAADPIAPMVTSTPPA